MHDAQSHGYGTLDDVSRPIIIMAGTHREWPRRGYIRPVGIDTSIVFLLFA